MDIYLKKYGYFIFIIGSIILYYYVGYQLVRHQFVLLITVVFLLFILYWFAIKYLNFNWWLIVLPRLVFLMAVPVLSDDYFRFVWDGLLVANGQNPFQYLPSQLPQTLVFDGLNSKHYYSVYPPLLQLIFGLSAHLAKGNILNNLIILRLFIIAADIGSIYLIIKILSFFKMPKNRAFLYALNPLVIIELTGNLHFEAISIFFLLLCIYALFVKQKLFFAALSLAASVLIKMLPLVFIPLIITYLGFRKGLLFAMITALFIILAFLPFLNFTIISNISQSLDLYFQKFEFNGSFYNLVKWLGIIINKNNPIMVAGPILSLVAFFIILWLAFKEFKSEKTNNHKINAEYNFIYLGLLSISVYFLLATTVHPWYLTTLLALACFTHYKYVVVWSGMVVLSYSAYHINGFHENFYLIFVEYAVVFSVILFDFKRLTSARPSNF